MMMWIPLYAYSVPFGMLGLYRACERELSR